MIVIKIKTENDSFHDDTVTHDFRKRNEVARILSDLSESIRHGSGPGYGLLDHNGQKVGEVELTGKDKDLRD